MFKPSREQARRLFFETWRKYRQREILSGIETIALEVILMHPEYQDILADAERYLDKDYLPEAGDTNPFLHMSLHVSIEEQLSIDQPAGIVAAFTQRLQDCGDRHVALHAVLDCLAEMVWRAQRDHLPPDANAYLLCVSTTSTRSSSNRA